MDGPDRASVMTLAVLHPNSAIRAQVIAACPETVHAQGLSHVDELEQLTLTGPLVVALDPARTSPVAVTAALGKSIHVLSISDLRLDVADPAVDSMLPRRRLTPHSLARHLRHISPLEGTAPTRVSQAEPGELS